MRKIIIAIINFFKNILNRNPKTEIEPEIVIPIKSVDPDKPIKKKKPKRRYYQLEKKERIKRRWEGKIRFENEKRGVV